MTYNGMSISQMHCCQQQLEEESFASERGMHTTYSLS